MVPYQGSVAVSAAGSWVLSSGCHQVGFDECQSSCWAHACLLPLLCGHCVHEPNGVSLVSTKWVILSTWSFKCFSAVTLDKLLHGTEIFTFCAQRNLSIYLLPRSFCHQDSLAHNILGSKSRFVPLVLSF